MWNLNENESNVEPWDADEYVDNRDVDLRVDENEATHDDLNDINEDGPCNLDLDESYGIVQAKVFTGYYRYENFNKFAEENDIGAEDIVSIANESNNVESRIVLFYLK